jgi:hypothetical protein
MLAQVLDPFKQGFIASPFYNHFKGQPLTNNIEGKRLQNKRNCGKYKYIQICLIF